MGLVTYDMGGKNVVTWAIKESKRQRHATLRFLKIDMRHWGPSHQGPHQHPPAHVLEAFVA